MQMQLAPGAATTAGFAATTTSNLSFYSPSVASPAQFPISGPMSVPIPPSIPAADPRSITYNQSTTQGATVDSMNGRKFSQSQLSVPNSKLAPQTSSGVMGLSDYPEHFWFVGKMARAQSEALLAGLMNGTFLVRESESTQVFIYFILAEKENMP